MTSVNNNKLEASKARLATAFSNLEAIIEKKINATKIEQNELDRLKEERQQLEDDNKKLSNDVANIELDQIKIKNFGFEALQELEASITLIEEILGTDSDNSKHID